MSGRALRVALATLCAGCVASPAELRRPVDAELARRLAPATPLAIAVDGPEVRAATTALLAAPLELDGAIRIALAHNPRLRAALDALGIPAGELASATVLPPLHVDVAYRWGGAARELELEATQGVLQLITGGHRRAAARADLAAATADATATALRLTAAVELAFHDVAAAGQEVELRQTAFDAADAAATLRERMAGAGNTTDLALAREHDGREQARLELDRARASALLRREGLTTLLGLGADAPAWTITAQLPALPDQPPALGDLERAAVAASLDLAAGRARVVAADERWADQRRRAWLPDLAIGASVVTRDGEQELGPALRLGLPLFDQRQGERARAAAELHRAEHEDQAVELELRAAARVAATEASATYAEARQLRDVILPLRQQIVDETLRHYNAMDADPFALLLARQQLVDAGHQYVDALRRFANAATRAAALARGVSLTATPTATPSGAGGDATH